MAVQSILDSRQHFPGESPHPLDWVFFLKKTRLKDVRTSNHAFGCFITTPGAAAQVTPLLTPFSERFCQSDVNHWISSATKKRHRRLARELGMAPGKLMPHSDGNSLMSFVPLSSWFWDYIQVDKHFGMSHPPTIFDVAFFWLFCVKIGVVTSWTNFWACQAYRATFGSGASSAKAWNRKLTSSWKPWRFGKRPTGGSRCNGGNRMDSVLEYVWALIYSEYIIIQYYTDDVYNRSYVKYRKIFA